MTGTRAAATGPVIYLVSRFPKVTETFIIDEIVELRRCGLQVQVCSLMSSSVDVIQPAAEELVATARFGSRSPAVLLAAQVHWLRRRPLALLRVWATVASRNRSSPGEWVKSVITTVVATAWARDLAGEPVQRLHAHWATHPALAAWVISRLTGLRYGITAHAHDIYGENGMLREKVREADLAVTISEFNRRLLRDRLGPDGERFRVLHCGVDRARLTPTPVRAGPLAEVSLLTVASLRDYKGHRHLLDALALLRARGVRFRYRLAGDGPLRGDLMAQATRLGIDDAVEFLGNRTADEVHRLLAECDVFVLPSVPMANGLMEGIPVALMEALASGRPVVATALSGIPELVRAGESGLLVQPGDATGLADAVQRLAGDDDLRLRFAAAAPASVSDGFDLQTNVARLHAWLTAGGAPVSGGER